MLASSFENDSVFVFIVLRSWSKHLNIVAFLSLPGIFPICPEAKAVLHQRTMLENFVLEGDSILVGIVLRRWSLHFHIQPSQFFLGTSQFCMTFQQTYSNWDDAQDLSGE